uniref:6-phosphogluconate dehydrogenase NADP-binding domain-containing protein n=1 Tax=Amorphochlora amoebiformis TaxID=1561963 RepID=A0A7S0H1K9_9EUKA
MSKESIAFLGAGLMAVPMVSRLLDAGYCVHCWNRTLSKCEPMQKKGAKVHKTSASAMKSAERYIFVMLSAAPAIDQVLLKDAQAKAELKGKVIVVMSTISPEESKEFAAKIEKAGSLGYVESPVLGSVPHATKGVLSILTSTNEEKTFTDLKPLLSVLGNPRYMGKITAASTYKVALNQMLAVNTAALGYSLGYVRRAGHDPSLFMEVLQGGVLKCAYYSFKGQPMIDRKYTPTNFTTKLLHKDVMLAVNGGKKLGLNTIVQEGLAGLIQQTIDSGDGEKDFSIIYNTIDKPTLH